MPEGPLLALALRREPRDGLRALLSALAHWARPAVFDEAVGRSFRAAVVDDPLLVGLLPIDVSYALWVPAGDDARDAEEASVADDRVALVLSPDRRVVTTAGGKGRFVPDRPHAFPQARPVPPFVRARLRVARGLPASAVASVTDEGLTWCGARCASDLIDTVLGLAACIVVQGSPVTRALAWGAPCVVDAATAAHFGLTDGIEAVVARDDDAATAAAAVAGDPVLAAGLSREGRAHFESTVDIERIAVTVAKDLGLLPPRGERLPALIAELGGPVDGRTSARTQELVAGLR